MKLNTNKCRISFIIPTYNAIDCLGDCVDHLLNQTCDKDLYEIIIIDDGSSDGTDKLCNKYAKKYNNITVIHQKNSGGPSTGRNKGLKIAKGEYVFFHDHDDYLGSDAVNMMIYHLNEWNPDIMLVKIATSTKRSIPKIMFDKNYESASPYTDKILRTVGPWKLYRKEFLIDNDIYFLDLPYEDALFNFKAYFLAKKISVASDYNYYYFNYRNNKNNLSYAIASDNSYYGNNEKNIKTMNTLNDEYNKYVDKTKDLSEVSYKLGVILYQNLNTILRQNCTQEQLDRLYAIAKNFYNDEQSKKQGVDRYILLNSFIKTHDLAILKDLYIKANNKNLNAIKKDNKIYIPTLDEKFLIDVTSYYSSKYLTANISKATYNKYILTIEGNVSNITNLNKLFIALVPDNDFDKKILYDVKIINKDDNNISMIDNIYKDINNFLINYQIESSINILDFNKYNMDNITYDIYLYIDDNSKVKIKNCSKKFLSKSFVINDNIVIPDLDKGFICYRKLSHDYDKNAKYIFYKERILENRIIFASLIKMPYDITKNIVNDIYNNNLKITYTPLKRYIKYSYNGKIYKIPNKKRIYHNKYIKKFIKFKKRFK